MTVTLGKFIADLLELRREHGSEIEVLTRAVQPAEEGCPDTTSPVIIPVLISEASSLDTEGNIVEGYGPVFLIFAHDDPWSPS
jgi:hypothetical protein